MSGKSNKSTSNINSNLTDFNIKENYFSKKLGIILFYLTKNTFYNKKRLKQTMILNIIEFVLMISIFFYSRFNNYWSSNPFPDVLNTIFEYFNFDIIFNDVNYSTPIYFTISLIFFLFNLIIFLSFILSIRYHKLKNIITNVSNNIIQYIAPVYFFHFILFLNIIYLNSVM